MTRRASTLLRKFSAVQPEASRSLGFLTVLYVILTVLYAVLTVLYVVLTVSYIVLTVLYVTLTVLYVVLTVLYVEPWCGTPPHLKLTCRLCGTNPSTFGDKYLSRGSGVEPGCERFQPSSPRPRGVSCVLASPILDIDSLN